MLYDFVYPVPAADCSERHGKTGISCLYESGEFEERADRAFALLRRCTVCPPECRVDCIRDRRGFCRTGLLPVIASSGPHLGEEPPPGTQQGWAEFFRMRPSVAIITSGEFREVILNAGKYGLHQVF